MIDFKKSSSSFSFYQIITFYIEWHLPKMFLISIGLLHLRFYNFGRKTYSFVSMVTIGYKWSVLMLLKTVLKTMSSLNSIGSLIIIFMQEVTELLFAQCFSLLKLGNSIYVVSSNLTLFALLEISYKVYTSMGCIV